MMDKIVCLGKNYHEHAKELGDPIPENPVLFLKPPSVLKTAAMGEIVRVTVPSNKGALHPECEIVFKLNRGGYCLSAEQAQGAIGEFTVGIDMTLRDCQAKLKKEGHPWTIAKVFPNSAIIGPLFPYEKYFDHAKEPFCLWVEGELRQQGFAKEMTFDPVECVAYASQFFPLSAGDLLFTGTPKGVSAVRPGQKIDVSWGDIRYTVGFE